jgi:thioredoxin
MMVLLLPAIAFTQEVVKPEQLTSATFREKVFDYIKNKEAWLFAGDKPCVVDFYADWCRPCRMLSPIMDQLATDYKDRVNFYKVNTEKEREVAAAFGITSLPSIMFCPMEGRPRMSTGAASKEFYVKVIDENLLGIKTEEKK